MTYQWRVDKGSGPAAIPGATSSTLTLANLQTTDSGSYSLQAADAYGRIGVTDSSAFVVNDAPDPDGNHVIVSKANQYHWHPTGGKIRA
jgi:hypothetical protein